MDRTTPGLTEAIRGELKAAGLTQERIGEVLGITQSAVSKRIRSGKWHADELLQLSAAFGIPLHRLYGEPEGRAS